MVDFANPIHGKEIDKVTEDDRLWFESNPDRNFRLRHTARFELNGREPFPVENENTYTLVAQAIPGSRFRICIAAFLVMPVEKIAEQELRALFEDIAPKEIQELITYIRSLKK
jgi:hypothetical protein